MFWYSFEQWLIIIVVAIIIDWIIGDPKYPTHPVIWMGRWIRLMQAKLYHQERKYSNRSLFWRGFLLMSSTLLLVAALMIVLTWVTYMIHPWLSYVLSAWLLSTTIAVKGLKDAAMLVYRPLADGNLLDAQKYVGYIVSRDSNVMKEADITRATVETVSENIVDAFVAPIFWALIGGAPLAMVYRACNTLDSMVGYRNEQYEWYGKCSARLDDIMNYIPARLTGICIVIVSVTLPYCDAARSARSITTFAKKHPSPNSGIPESAVAGALHIELGGLNSYFGQWQERARLGWPKQQVVAKHIIQAISILHGVRLCVLGGVIVIWLIMNASK